MALYSDDHFAFVAHPDAISKWSLDARIKAAVIEPLLPSLTVPGNALREARIAAAKYLAVAWRHRNPGKEQKRTKRMVSAQSIYTWLDAFKKGGINELERTTRQGGSTLSPELYQYVRDMLVTTNYPLTEVQHRASNHARDKLELPEEEWPTIDEVRYIDFQLCDSVKSYGSEGREAYRRTYEMAGRFEAAHPNEMWQCDHHLCDIQVLNPDTGQYERPWISLFIDDFTRCIMGFHLSFEANSNTIALALHQAMVPKTIPEWTMLGIATILYADNGKDYRSNHIRDVCLHFRIELKHHEPHNPRSKGKVERFFRTLEEQLIRYLPGYLGNSPKNRPRHVNPSLTVDELRTKIIEYIVTRYHKQIHRSLKATPLSRWTESKHVIRRVENEEDVDHLMESDTRKVQDGKGIQFKNGFYTDSNGLLEAHSGEEVRLFFDRNDISRIRVWFRDKDRERFLCEAVRDRGAKELAGIAQTRRQEIGRDVSDSRARQKEANKLLTKTEGRTPSKGEPISSEQIPPDDAKSTGDQPPRRRIRYIHEIEDDE